MGKISTMIRQNGNAQAFGPIYSHILRHHILFFACLNVFSPCRQVHLASSEPFMPCTHPQKDGACHTDHREHLSTNLNSSPNLTNSVSKSKCKGENCTCDYVVYLDFTLFFFLLWNNASLTQTWEFGVRFKYKRNYWANSPRHKNVPHGER